MILIEKNAKIDMYVPDYMQEWDADGDKCSVSIRMKIW